MATTEEQTIEALRKCLSSALECIDAIPEDVAAKLPMFLKFDRNWASSLINNNKASKSRLSELRIQRLEDGDVEPAQRERVLADLRVLFSERNIIYSAIKAKAILKNASLKLTPAAYAQLYEYIEKVPNRFSSETGEYLFHGVVLSVAIMRAQTSLDEKVNKKHDSLFAIVKNRKAGN